MHKGLLIDFTKCIGCGACMECCRDANDLPTPPSDRPDPDKLDSENLTVVLALKRH